MPSSIEVSIMLLGDDVEDLRRTVGGGRGSIRQPFTLRGRMKGGEKMKMTASGKEGNSSKLIKSDIFKTFRCWFYIQSVYHCYSMQTGCVLASS